ncbi:hypothetical protein ZHAS_00015666 [Anopheles sinensis]|uniref:Uncharacterized protein n=1 Tax=Anopheles sinensis TaxID=74873 RepID=A0A084WB23_ANOSI|nr:hypothetical protein ZHAS_00015666 [Anopheles sinensis]
MGLMRFDDQTMHALRQRTTHPITFFGPSSDRCGATERHGVASTDNTTSASLPECFSFRFFST